jgi:hypothetical protein
MILLAKSALTGPFAEEWPVVGVIHNPERPVRSWRCANESALSHHEPAVEPRRGILNIFRRFCARKSPYPELPHRKILQTGIRLQFFLPSRIRSMRAEFFLRARRFGRGDAFILRWIRKGEIRPQNSVEQFPLLFLRGKEIWETRQEKQKQEEWAEHN